MINLSNYGRELELLAYKSVNENRSALNDYDDLMAKKDNYYKNQYQQLVNAITKDVNDNKFGAQNTTILHDDGTQMVMVDYYITDGNPIRVDIVKSAMEKRPSGDKKVGGNPNANTTQATPDDNYQPKFIQSQDGNTPPTVKPAPGYEWTYNGVSINGPSGWGWEETKINKIGQNTTISDRAKYSAPLG